MIKNCPKCNKYPRVKTLINCANDKCLEYEVEHYVWDWQKLPRIDKDKFDQIFEVKLEG